MVSPPDLMAIAETAVEAAKAAGADDVAVRAGRSRFIDLEFRDGELEKIAESTSSGMGVAVYADGRFSSHGTSDLRPEALEVFIKRAVDMTRLLGPDPHRALADPALYQNRPDDDLDVVDESYDTVDTQRRKSLAAELGEAARGVSDDIISVTSGYYDSYGESVRIHSNGFVGRSSGTQFWMGAQVSVSDADGKKPRASHWIGARHHDELIEPEAVGRQAAERALARRGQSKIEPGRMTVIIENRAGAGVLRHLLSAMSGAAVQQKRSFLTESLEKSIASDVLTIVDDPLLPRGFGSRHYDGDGISARRRTLVDKGVLTQFLIDVYYGRKLGMEPTGGSASNVIIRPGERSAEQIIKGLDHGLYVTGFLGGNADGTRGDFSLGVVGFRIKDGALADPIGEVNMTGNHTELWNRLVEVGNDPWPYSSARLPTLVFDDVSVA